MKKILMFIVMLLYVTSITAQDEERIRYILADLSCGGPLSYYQQHTDNKNVAEAVKRWINGVRVVNVSSFERKIVEGSWKITYRGTNRDINGMDVKLNSEVQFNEERVRYILADISCGGPLSYYQERCDNENVAEAVKRWVNGVRVSNSRSFERKIVNGTWKITYQGTDREINGMDVRLTN